MKAWLLVTIGVWSCLASLASTLDGPKLSITNVSGGFLVSWPASATDWVLDQSPHLQPPVPWTGVSPNLYQSNGGSRCVLVSAFDANRFYRLRKGAALPGPGMHGLTGYWQLDEGAGQSSVDATAAGTEMFLANTVWASGRFGPSGIRYNGAGAHTGGSRAWVNNSDYRVLPSASRPFSASLWFNPDALTLGWRGVMGNDTNGSNGWRVALHSPGHGTNFLVLGSVGSGMSLSVTGRTLLLPNQWRRLTVTYDGTVGSIYLDSTLLARGSGDIVNHGGPLYFGGGIGSLDSFLGRLDDIRVYTNCLTHEEISLSGHWRFDEGAGRLASDSSIYGHHASVTGGAAWSPDHQGTAIDLSTNQVLIRNEEYAVLPGSGGAFSLSFWLRPDSLAPGRSGLMSCGEGTSSGWRLTVDTEGSGKTWLSFESTNFGGTLELRGPLALTNGVWSKLDITFNGGIGTAYHNGRQIGTRSGAIRGSRAPLAVGPAVGLSGFSGVIDDLRIYSRERAATEIGPIAQTMWETVLINSTTNIPLQGFGPAGMPLTYSILPLISPTNGAITHIPGSPVVAYSAGRRKGPDAFVYAVSDGEFTSEPAVVTLSVVEPHWVSPGGGSIGPLDGSSPAHAWMAGTASALDAIWKTNNYYDCFFYAAGQYETRGWKYGERSTANPGCKHVGSGSSGPGRTKLTLVDIWEPWNEEMIFANLLGYSFCDAFEVHRMALDCNAENVPKYNRGEPVWIRIPLAAPARVNSVTLRWDDSVIPGTTAWRFGPAVEFSLCTKRFATNSFFTNCSRINSTGLVDVLPVGTDADEIILSLDRRAPGVDFYSLAEVEVFGGAVSLPMATVPDGSESQLDPQLSILSIVDDDPGTVWASGPENRVEIVIPLPQRTSIDRVNLRWNCQALAGLGRLGPASDYVLRAWDENLGKYNDLSFVRHNRTSAGWETNTIGTLQSTNSILTDRLMIVLTARELSVDFYSLHEVTLQHGSTPVQIRRPVALNSLPWGAYYSVLRAFDVNPGTQWASSIQGAVGAIYVQGNNLKFTDLKVTGFGTTAARESFPMYFFALGHSAEPKHLGNVLVEDCIFSEPAASNRDGLTTVQLGANPPDTLTNAVVRRCSVTGVKSNFVYSHGIAAPVVENCIVEDCGVAVYFEPDASSIDDFGPILIRSNQFINVDFGMYLLSHPGAQFDSITWLDNEIVLNRAGGWGFGVCDTCSVGPSGSITNVTVLNNIFRYPEWTPSTLSHEGGIFYSDMHHAVVGNNLIALGTRNDLRIRHCPAGFIPPFAPAEDCDHPVLGPPGDPSYPACLDALIPGYRRAWFNNRNLSGGLLPVQFNNFGSDIPASQQQWAE